MAGKPYRPHWDRDQGRLPYKLSPEQLDQLEEMSIYQCTTEELGHAFGVCRQTFVTMTKRDPEMMRRMVLGQSKGKRALRAVQFKVALSGNTNMLVWLGRCYLDQDPDGKITINGAGSGELSEEARAHLIEMAKHIQQLAQTQGAREVESSSAIMKDIGNGNGNGAKAEAETDKSDKVVSSGLPRIKFPKCR